MKRRQFTRLPLFLLGLGLTHCTNTRSGTKPQIDEGISSQASTHNSDTAAQLTKLNWIGHWLHEDKRETLVREVAQEFAFLNQNTEINLKFWREIGLSGKVEAAKLIVKMLQSGRIEWDIVWLDDNIYALVADQLGDWQWGEKYLVDFGRVNGFTKTQKPFISNNPEYKKQTGNTLVGPHIEGYYYALYYNANVASKLGIKIQHQDMTFEHLLDCVEAVYRHNRRNSTNIGAFYESKDWTTLEILFQNLIKSEIEDFEQAKAEVGTARKQEALLKTFQAFEALGKYNPLISSHNENIWFDTRQLVLEDKVLFYVGGTWMYSHWRGINKNEMTKIVPVELPVFQKVNHYLGGYIPTWAVPKNAPNRDQAIKLMLFWSRPKIAEKWVRYTKNPTGIQGNFSVAEIGTDVFEKFQSEITAKFGANVHYSNYSGYIFGEQNKNLNEDLKTVIRNLLTGKVNATQAYKQITLQVK